MRWSVCVHEFKEWNARELITEARLWVILTIKAGGSGAVTLLRWWAAFKILYRMRVFSLKFGSVDPELRGPGSGRYPIPAGSSRGSRRSVSCVMCCVHGSRLGRYGRTSPSGPWRGCAVSGVDEKHGGQRGLVTPQRGWMLCVSPSSVCVLPPSTLRLALAPLVGMLI